MSAPAALAVLTRRVPDVADLAATLPAGAARDVFSWVREGEGIVGYGVAWEARTVGPTRMEDADVAWRSLVAACAVDDDVRRRGTGLLALGSFAFADESPAGGVLRVPRVIVGRRDGVSWVTLVRRVPAGADAAEVLETLRSDVADEPMLLTGPAQRAADAGAVPKPGRITEHAPDGSPDADERWRADVAGVVARIRGGEVRKVVLARAVDARTEERLDVRHLVGRLHRGYPNTWTFAVDGLVGATPEMLVRRDRGLAAARVLAGTVPRVGDESDDLRVARALASSSKDLAEHEFAVASLVRALDAYCASMNVPDEPFVLRLPNVMHLASDVTGAVLQVEGLSPSSLLLAEALHPTAAVGGTPTDRAVDIIGEVEADRGRYAGPVGWLDAAGDGEWGIALRCGAVRGEHTVRLHAGCGIVAGSEPATEFAESEAKLAPLRWALGADRPARPG